MRYLLWLRLNQFNEKLGCFKKLFTAKPFVDLKSYPTFMYLVFPRGTEQLYAQIGKSKYNYRPATSVLGFYFKHLCFYKMEYYAAIWLLRLPSYLPWMLTRVGNMGRKIGGSSGGGTETGDLSPPFVMCFRSFQTI